MMHVSLHYHGFVDERPWRLADMLRVRGGVAGGAHGLPAHACCQIHLHCC